MNSHAKPPTSSERVRAHRQRLREQGLRPIQIWVPDVRSPEFKAEARRQSLAVSQSPSEVDDQAFIDSISDYGPDFDWGPEWDVE